MTIGVGVGAVLWLVNAASLLFMTWQVWRLLRLSRPALNLLAGVFLFMFLATLQMLSLGLAGRLWPVSVALAGLVAAGLTLLSQGLNRVRAQARSDFAQMRGVFGRWWQALPPWAKWLVGLTTVLSAARFAFLTWALPPFVWDSLTYHLTNVAHWTQSGRIELFDVPVTRIYSAANYEVLTTWFTVFLHQDTFIEASGILPYLLGMIAVYAIVRSLETRTWVALLAAGGYGSTPAMLMAATGTKNDPQMAGLYLALIALVFDWGVDRADGRNRDSLGRVWLIGLLLLYAAGTKAYIIHLLPGLALIAVGAALVHRRGTDRRSWLHQLISQLRGLSPRKRLGMLGLVMCGLMLGGYWNLRNWVLTGNPVYPYGFNVGDAEVIGGDRGSAETNLQQLVDNLEILASKFGDRRGRIKPDLPRTTGWGWFAYGIGLPALLWTTVRRRRFLVLTMGFVLALLTLFLSTRPSEWNMRYTIWFPALFSLGFAVMLEWMAGHSPWPTRGTVALAVFCMGMNFVMTLNYNQVSQEQFAEMLSLPTAERDAARLGFSVPEEYVEALELVPRGAVLGFNVNENGFIYPLYRADFSQQIVYVPISGDESCQTIAATMQERRTRWVLVAPVMSDESSIGKLRQCNEQGGPIRERAHNLYVIQTD